MKYYLDKLDTVTRVYVKYENIADFNTFSIELTVRVAKLNSSYIDRSITVRVENLMNSLSEIIATSGFIDSYRSLRKKILSGSPIDTFLNIFESNLTDGEKLLLKILE